jgi:formylglycine-generating enzyme required for sulfatase activity
MEAEWEYAARAGTKTAFANGGITHTGCSPPDPNLDDVGWYCGNDGVNGMGTTHPVAQKLPNAWGLYDMHGNVWEWCSDWYDYYPSSAVSDPSGPSSGLARVLRGGSWCAEAGYCRFANRAGSRPNKRFYDYGFRLVFSPQVSRKNKTSKDG